MAALVVCCAGPGLLAAGVLGTVGAALDNPRMIAAALLLAAGAVGRQVRHHRVGTRKNHACRGDR
ncbi:hypothetical protein ABZZ74_50115 [Streptomyces sp. NPDC006476]|uniref:hypothetical protein n=1 Tax=Streptomyces sp. NPDC006476 TaxID=3157175 RepID=UPI0033A769BB